MSPRAPLPEAPVRGPGPRSWEDGRSAPHQGAVGRNHVVRGPDVYLEVQNVTNRQNPEEIVYSARTPASTEGRGDKVRNKQHEPTR